MLFAMATANACCHWTEVQQLSCKEGQNAIGFGRLAQQYLS